MNNLKLQVKTRSRWAISLRYSLVISVILSLIVPAASYVVSAQQADHPWREVRTLYMMDYGFSNPKGLVFSPTADTFLLWQEDGSVAGIEMHEEPVDVQGLRIPADDVHNIAYNEYAEMLFVLNSDATQLDEFRVDAKGLPASSLAPAKRNNLEAVNMQGARGVTFDPANGRMFVLNAEGSELVVVTPDPVSRFDGNAIVSGDNVTRVDLNGLGAASLQGIAFNPSNGYLYILDPIEQRLYEVTQSGKKVFEYDLRSLQMTSPETLVFAPSVDGTDDPATMNLFVLDSGQQTISGDGSLVELALGPAAALPPGTALLPATLVQTVDISNAAWNPSSPDPAGIDYWPQQDRFVIADSEVDEMPPYYQNANVFLATTSGTLTGTCDTTDFTPEPTGVAINPNNNHIFIASDSGDQVFEISLGPDGQYCTSDDTVTSTSFASLFGANDAEDVAYGNNTIFVSGGTDAEVWIIPLGPNGVLGGGDDGTLNHFDTASLGFQDLEGIGYNASADTLFILSSNSDDRYMGEVTPSGTLLRAYDLSFMGSAGNIRSDVTYAPSSQHPGFKSIYIVSRGIDNGFDPNENDGKWWEINIGDEPPTHTPDPNATPTFTPTSTFTPSPVPTNTLPPDASTNPMYVSFASSGTIGGVDFADEDILRFGGTSWSLFFDGSDVGVSALDAFGFTLLDANTALFTFNTSITLDGAIYDPTDIVQFNATSFGDVTAGTFTMYLNGSDVGLDTTSENIDSVSVLPDGRVLISTTGNPSVPGVTGNDEDILAFTPTSLGNNTAGSWAMYFDGSDVDLATSSSEDIDALDVIQGNIYLSTLGDFSVAGVSGASNDIFICSPTSLGDVTACSFQPALYFDGSTWNAGSNNIDAFAFLALGPLPTATPTGTPTDTPPATFTPTATATSTPPAGVSTNPMYVSFASTGSVGGVPFVDEDILRFDGSTWGMFFDGSDVGVSALDAFGFTLLDANTALFTFNTSIILGATTYDPTDIVQFNATSFGDVTAGTFTMYLDGSDAGLDTSAENIDLVSVLPDGRVLISTTGNPSVPGVTGFDEDILAFTPTSLGDNTSGSWELYFDGSDVGLADASSEDTDALDVVQGNIYLSTLGDFAVTGVTGTSNDIFSCSPTSLGDVTACSFQPDLYFDGSTWGLGTNNIDAFAFLALGPLPTATPTNTPGPTATPTDTPTATPTSTPPPGASTNPMYISFASTGSVGGVASVDEDILRFDGTSWSLFFDGSDVGVSAPDAFGFTLLDANTALFTFNTSITLDGAIYDPTDIVQFNATSFGDVTAGTFTMYLNGSDVGLDTTSENIDSVSVLPDGRVLISTTGNPSVPGVTGNDEDILAFTPTSLGNNTAGSWAMYFDGSDVGLADASSEDIDALDVIQGNIYLSTLGDFSVAGVSGASNDIFICSPTSLGDVTACSFQPALYFDGSTWNAGSNNIDAFAFLALGPLPTPTNTPVVAATNTPSSADLIFADGFEAGNLAAWTPNTIDLGDLGVSPAAALVGSQGMQAVIDDNTAIYVNDETPNAETRYRARFYFDPNSISMASGDTHYILQGYTGTTTQVLRVQFRFSSGSYQVRAMLRNDASTWTNTNWFTISDTTHYIELDWRAATGAGTNDGGLTLWIDNIQQADLTGTDNDTRRIDHVQLGAVTGIDVGTRGTYYFDAFESRRQTYIGPAGGGPAATPTNTPMAANTPTAGPSPTPTNTPTPTATPAATLTPTPTNTPGSSDLIFADGFESDDLSAWTANTNDQGDLSVSTTAALVGTRGLQALLDDTNGIYLTDDTPNAEPHYRARFYFDPNSITMASGSAHFIFRGFVDNSTQIVRMEFRQFSGSYQIRAALVNDGSTWVSTSFFTISDAPHFIEFNWRAATAAGANDGGLTLWIDNIQQADLTGVDNDTRRVDRVRLGAIASIDAGTSGIYYFDAFESRRQTFIGP